MFKMHQDASDTAKLIMHPDIYSQPKPKPTYEEFNHYVLLPRRGDYFMQVIGMNSGFTLHDKLSANEILMRVAKSR